MWCDFIASMWGNLKDIRSLRRYFFYFPRDAGHNVSTIVRFVSGRKNSKFEHTTVCQYIVTGYNYACIGKDAGGSRLTIDVVDLSMSTSTETR